jgi:4a-hydroxytetrahydrobiopterin dehydratase
MSMTELLNQHCTPLEGQPPMPSAEIEQQLLKVKGWAHFDGALEKTFSFKNYYETLAFVNALAFICHAEDHHPELRVFYNRCVVRFDTHSLGGISINDFICAAKANALLAEAA